ncbi:MAG: hypothetical protein ABI767_05450 [Rhodanobacter sp.]
MPKYQLAALVMRPPSGHFIDGYLDDVDVPRGGAITPPAALRARKQGKRDAAAQVQVWEETRR